MAWLDPLESLLNPLLADADVLRWAFLGGLGLLIFLLAFLIGRAIERRLDPVKGRIDALVTSPMTGGGGQSIPLSREARGQRLLQRLGRGLTPTSSEKKVQAADKLARIGYRSPGATDLFFSIKVLGALGLPLGTTILILLFQLMPLKSAVPLIALTVPIGLIFPDYWLTKKWQKRQAALRRSLPDALDMLVVCTQAGMGLNAAIQRVAMEMDIQHPELADELNTTMLHMGAGMDSRTALQELAKRTGLEEMRSLVSTLQQAMRYGSSVGDTLRAYAEEMRNKRLEYAQEQAAKVGVKMLIPIALCMLPAVMLVVMGPPMIKLMEGLGGK